MAKKPLDIDLAQILTFPFQDQVWLKKFLITSLLVLFSFIPVIPLVLLLGYAAEIKDSAKGYRQHKTTVAARKYAP